MLNSEFENKVRQQMEELKLSPADAVWDRVEAALPQKRKPKGWLMLLLFTGLITGAGFLYWNYTGKSENKSAESNLQGSQNKQTKNIPSNITGYKAENNFVQENVSTLAKEEPTHNKVPLLTNKKVNDTNTTQDSRGQQLTAQKKKQVFKNKSRTRMTVEPGLATTDAEENNFSQTLKKQLLTDISLMTATIPKPNDEPQKPDSNSKPEISVIASITEPASDTAKPSVPVNKKKNSPSKKWSYGVHISMGTSNVTSGLFETNKSMADAIYNSPSNIPGSGVGSAIQKPSTPVTSGAFTAGFFMQQHISARWRLHTGLNYTYQSNRVVVGNLVDSVGSFSFNSSTASAQNYYRNGRNVNYKNTFHHLQLPLLFQYKLANNFPLYAEAGTGVSYLLHSSALVYSSSRNAYLNDKTVFNKLGVTITAGAGIDLAKKTTFPFSAGYRFNYNLLSATKADFGNQHLYSNMLYVNFLLRK